jgi:hypothetical protein
MALHLSLQRTVLVMLLAVGMTMEVWAESGLPEPARWAAEGIIRVFDENTGRLLSGAYRKGGTFSTFNDMTLTNANSVTRMQATVTLLDAQAAGGSFSVFPRAGLEGFFYWDGTGTGTSSDQTGHVSASTQLALNVGTGQPEARFFAVRCNDATCSTSTSLVNDVLGSVRFFEPHRIAIEYDGARFSFQLDDSSPRLFAAPHQTRETPRVPFKALRTRILVPGSVSASASVLALFDNVLVNGVPYEDFDARTLPRVAIMPGSGTFISTQTSDVLIAVETGGQVLSDLKVLFDGADVSSLVATLPSGTLTVGGVTRLLRSFHAANLPPGPHLLAVEATFAGGVKARGTALWTVLATTEP